MSYATFAQLRHINLIPIYDFGVTDQGTPFFTEPYVQTLGLNRFSLDGENDSTLWRRVHVLLPVCDAPAYLHANELLHREVKPSNVLITQPFEEVFLVLGYPSLPAGKPRIDDLRIGRVFGAPQFMAPEQIAPDRFGPPTPSTTRMPKLCAYTLRHSYAHWQLTTGTDAPVVSKLLGHSDGRMLETRYGHVRFMPLTSESLDCRPTACLAKSNFVRAEQRHNSDVADR
jgi:serine/threonine protein kinase